MNTELVCFACMAAKGRYYPRYNFTDMSEHAPWRATTWNCEPPWENDVPEFTKLAYFEIKKIGADILHVWHLGVGRDVILGSEVFMEVLGCKNTYTYTPSE